VSRKSKNFINIYFASEYLNHEKTVDIHAQTFYILIKENASTKYRNSPIIGHVWVSFFAFQ